jgi:hypothetical protein
MKVQVETMRRLGLALVEMVMMLMALVVGGGLLLD